MNKWQQKYSELLEWQNTLDKQKFVDGLWYLVVTVLLMLVEDKLNEKA